MDEATKHIQNAMQRLAEHALKMEAEVDRLRVFINKVATAEDATGVQREAIRMAKEWEHG